MSFFSRIFRGSDNPKSESLSILEVREASREVSPADNPIHDKSDDLLGRDPIAKSFANQVLSLDYSVGLVVGVLAPWGYGKTSFINLTRKYFSEAGATIIDFNPWMFSGADQLVESFFVELSAQLRLRPSLEDVGKAIESYGEVFSGLGWIPFAGAWLERGKVAKDFVAKVLQSRREGVGGRRERVRKALSSLEEPIVVVIDDIDRLSTAEVRDMFKLVRLTANFPNVIYLTAFDRARVESALQEDGIPGRDYLEKILQLNIDLPFVPYHVLNQQIFSAIDDVLSKSDKVGTFTEDLWADVFVEVIRPLMRNMRDVRRYVSTLALTLHQLEGEIELVDVLALEAIRTFLPDVFSKMHESLSGLTTPAPDIHRTLSEPVHLGEQVNRLIDSGGDKNEVVRCLIKRLFPAAVRHIGGSHYGAEWLYTWRGKRRVAHPDIFRLYLERTVGEGLRAFLNAEKAWTVMTDEEAFDSFLRSLDPNEWENVISQLEVYEEDYTPEHVIPGITVLLNLLPEMPERRRKFLDLGARMVIGRVVFRLIRSLQDPARIEEAVRNITPRVRSLSSRLELIIDIGHMEGAGHKLVPEEVAARIEKEWRSEVQNSSIDELIAEKNLLKVLLLVRKQAGAAEQPLQLPESVEFTLALLRSARSETVSQSLESRSVRHSPRIAWEALITIYGSEEILLERIQALKATQREDGDGLLELVDMYVRGQRSNAFDD
jgi:hypothetical protein